MNQLVPIGSPAAGRAARRLGSYGSNGLLPVEYGRGPVTEERDAFVSQKR
jgi:hypothetical protein